MSKLFAAGLLLLFLLLLFNRTTAATKNSKLIKKGWNIVLLPYFSYNSDVGLSYGAFSDMFYFGDGRQYPDYRHKLSFQAVVSTKGTGCYRAFYDSEYLIPNSRLTVDLGYFPEKKLGFYGFNGYLSPYFKELPAAFYRFSRDMLRCTVDFQHTLQGHWAFLIGLGYYHYRLRPAKPSGTDAQPTLYQRYITEGLIGADESRGGDILQIKTGMIYDSRNRECDPTQGIQAEAILAASPDLINKKGYHHLKLTALFRHYLPLYREHLTLAYRLGYQSTLAGKAPFYLQSNINTLYMQQSYSEGLGGLSTLRGVLRNRVVGDGIAWLNTEIRYRFFHFPLFKQNWYMVLNPFFDAGRIVRFYRKSSQTASSDPYIYDGSRERLHLTAGFGGKMVMNQNFVLSLEWGKALDRRDGTTGLGLNMSFLF